MIITGGEVRLYPIASDRYSSFVVIGLTFEPLAPVDLNTEKHLFQSWTISPYICQSPKADLLTVTVPDKRKKRMTETVMLTN